MNLDTNDAVELAELLQLLHDWLATDAARLDESLNDFAGSRCCRRHTEDGGDAHGTRDSHV